MTAAESLVNRIVVALTGAAEFQNIPIVPGWSTAKRVKPCVVVSTTPLDSDHAQKRVLELSCELLSQRDDTPAETAHTLAAAIENQLTAQAPGIAAGMIEDGWKLMAFSTVSPYDEEDGERSWKTGYEYRVVMCVI